MCRARRSWRRRAEWRGRQGDAQATVRRAPACPFCLTIALTIALLWETKGGLAVGAQLLTQGGH
jgi:hypothetical protein